MKHASLNADILSSVIDFLSHDEQFHISLMHRILEHSDISSNRIWVFYDLIESEKINKTISAQHICAVFLYTKTRFLYHSISKAAHTDACAKLITALLHASIHTVDSRTPQMIEAIIGEKNGTLFLQHCIESAFKLHPAHTTDYHMMQNNTSDMCATNMPALENHFQIRFLEEKDIDTLLPLQKAYIAEEVNPSGSSASLSLCRSDLLLSLRHHRTCALLYKEKPLAKAAYNAQGLHWDQIGGVYTVLKQRNKGYARALVRFLAKNAQDRDKNTALFVRCQNPAAIASYKKAGFISTGFYRIVYYE